MLNVIFLFGTLSGLVVIGCMIGWMMVADNHADPTSLYVGYLIMIVALTMIFFGVKRYRDEQLGGVIKFLPALFVGLGIAVVAGIIYVAVWEVYLVATNYAFMDDYAKAMIEAERTKGTAAAQIDAMVAEFEALKVQYKDPLFRMPLTFLEIFPVGLIIAVISALILRNPRALPAHG
jgi:hypothetical protein